ncbi:MAG: hypothetical protein U0641_04700 [Anaerolineae bacterium]
MRARVLVAALLVALGFLVLGRLATAESPRADPTVTTPTPVPNTFTFQGQIQKNGGAVNGTCDLRFTLYDSISAGADVGGGSRLFAAQAVSNGVFTVSLPFGDAFQGGDRWVQTDVRCPAGSGSFVTLTPRQHLTAAPYAFGLRLPFTGSFASDGDMFAMSNAGLGSAGHFVMTNPSATDHAALVGESVAGDGVDGISTNSFGLYGESAHAAGIYGTTSAADNGGVVGFNSANGHGVEGYTGVGVGASGVYGQADAGFGVEGKSSGGTGVYGDGLYYGVYGQGGSNGVWGNSSAGNGVWGQSNSGAGVTGKSSSDRGVHGISATGDGVYGETKGGNAAKGVAGISPNGVGVYGESGAGLAGQFNGNVEVDGTLTQTYLGNPARAAPVAYAQVSQDGILQRGTSNVTSIIWDATSKGYVIRIANVYYGTGDFVTVVTPVRVSSIVPIVPVTTATGDGRLIVYLFDLGGSKIQSNFNFVVYAP